MMILKETKGKGKAGRPRTVRALKAEPIIRTLIQTEDKHMPLPDRAISSHLAELGIDLDFFTVSFLRRRMGIPASHKRRVRYGETVVTAQTQTT